MNKQRWQFWIDVGGTFTDCFALSPTGKEHQLKILSSGIVKGTAKFKSPDEIQTDISFCCDGFWNGAQIQFFDSNGNVVVSAFIVQCEKSNSRLKLDHAVNDCGVTSCSFQLNAGHTAPILAVHLLTEIPIQNQLSDCDVYLGTTKGTNALLTRTGAQTALIASSGLRDFLTIGDQARPKLFELTIQKPTPLFSTAIAIDERTLADGTVETPIDEKTIRQQLAPLLERGIDSLAVCLMHGFRYPDNEIRTKNIALDMGFREVRISSAVAPLIKLIPRAETTVLDAYLNPVIAEYLDSIQNSLGASSHLQLITSAGALSDRHLFTGKDSVLSGPAAGVVGAAGVAAQVGFEKCIGFDMGGTSTDVARFDGEFEIEYETEKAGIRILSPMMAIETVAAGGGSICDFDGTRLTVGPDSAGAHPGPACYGAGGPLTVTDINFFLGRLDENQFPFRLDRSAVESKLKSIKEKIALSKSKISEQEIAVGFLKIANHHMAAAIRTISVKKGFDARQYVLVSFGGAGSQHACAVANELAIEKILIHPKCSILSAFGIQLADQSYADAHTILAPLNETSLENCVKNATLLAEKLSSHFGNEHGLTIRYSLDLRFVGTQSAVNIAWNHESFVEDVRAGFHDKHRQLYGYTQDRPIEIVCVRTKVTKAGNRLPPQSLPAKCANALATIEKQFFSGDSIDKGPVFDWTQLSGGQQIVGPAIIASPLTSIIVDTGWSAKIADQGQVLLEKDTMPNETPFATNQYHADPVELEIFYSSFQSIARQMGLALQNTAISVNVKQRLDYSCAIFSATGELVVNAPHIPVHLGAMSDAVKSTIDQNSEIYPGDVFVTNDPYAGGSHLPDVTVLTPYFDQSADSNRPVFWFANRAHHAEIGGIAPGSMPAHATRLTEEGVLIDNFRVVEQGNQQFEKLHEILCNAKFPSRNPDENLADINAQIAANQMGIEQLTQLILRSSLPKVVAYADHIRSAAESKTRTALSKIEDFETHLEDTMDDGTKICMHVKKEKDHLAIDFTGTDSVHAGNLNANRSIVSSAIMYVLRCLIDEDIPLNSGVLQAVTLNLPDNCFLNPTPTANRGDCPAIVGGNVETSQRIVDILLGCFGVAAASQGTMNNWLVGDDQFGYYETVGGGSGATAVGPGADAIHCHMSNTRLTDPEILETAYPMILREFSIRDDSGGAGRFAGGNGMQRTVEFTAPLILSILGSRRTTSPFGLQGGETGTPGRATLIRQNGDQEVLASQCEHNVDSGDQLQLKTPGGGGFGKE